MKLKVAQKSSSTIET